MSNIDNLKVALETAKEKYRTIVTTDDGIDTKAGTLLGFEIALVIGYFSLIIGTLKDLIKLIEGIGGLISLIASIIILIIVHWPKTYFFPVSKDFFEKKLYLQQTEQEVLEGLIADTQQAIEKNRQKPNRKVKLYRIALRLLIIASFLLILSKLPKFYV